MQKEHTFKTYLRRAGIVLLVAVLAVMSTLVVCAFFSSQLRLYTDDGTTEYFRAGMELNTFFDIINSGTSTGTVATGVSLGIPCTDPNAVSGGLTTVSVTENGVTTLYYSYNPDAEWGSASNPYLISRVNHLQNLYVLQNCGYFTDLTEGGTDESDMPYFLVCNSNGTPATINGTGKIYEYIGNDEYPFIGYLGGAFTEGTTTTADGKTADQSVIENLTVRTDEDVVDVGLFGHIGYLGDESTAVDGKFKGAVSTVRDLVLCDVTVSVSEKDLWTALVDATAHLFSFSKMTESMAAAAPHENHHIGILAGHVEYATVQYISVYYTDTSVPAIDVDFRTADANGVAPNYKSVSGILGFVYNMNAPQSEGDVSMSGINNEDIEVNTGGDGSGGGLLSGTGRGYVTAKTIYENYYTEYDNIGNGTRDNISQNDRNGQIVWKFDIVGQSGTEYGPMIDKIGSNYYLHENHQITASISGDLVIVNGCEWSSYILCDLSDANNPTYRSHNGKELNSFSMTNLKMFDALSLENGTPLCTEYIRNRILWGTDPTGMYYFYDGVFTFSLSDTTDVIKDTWLNNTPDKITLGQNDDDLWTTAASGDINATVAFVKQVTSADDLVDNRKLFIAYKDSSNIYHIITLADNSDYNRGDMNNAVTTPSTSVALVTTDEKAALKEALDGGYLTLDSADADSGTLITEEQLSEDWDDVMVFDIGGATKDLTLDELKAKYQVTATWNSATGTATMYEDDGETAVTDTLKTNAQSAKSNYYLLDGKTADTNYTNGTHDYFLLGNDAAGVNLATLKSSIQSQNALFYEEDWTTLATDTSGSPLATRVTVADGENTPVTQTEVLLYKNGYYYFDTHHDGAYCYFRLYKVDANGVVTDLDHSTRLSWLNIISNDAYKQIKKLFTATSTDSNGVMYGTYKGTSLPVLYELDHHYYYTWTRDSGDANYIVGGTEVLAALGNGKFGLKYTATYYYIVATLTGNGVKYTWMGSTIQCDNVTGTKRSIASENNLNLGIYTGDIATSTACKDYKLYECTVNGQKKEGFIITRYQLDGAFVKTLTGNGIDYCLQPYNDSIIDLEKDLQQNNLKANVATAKFVSNASLNLPTGLAFPRTSISLGTGSGSVSFRLYMCGDKLTVRICNYKIDGYILATITSKKVSYAVHTSASYSYTVENVTAFTYGNENNLSELTYSLSNGSRSRNYVLYTNDQGALGVLFFIDGQDGGTYTFSHRNPVNSTDPYVLRVVRRAYIASYYSITVGTNEYVTNANNFTGVTTPSVSNNSDATIIFNNDGTVYIRYTINGHVCYLQYSASGNYFNSQQTNPNDNCKLYLFTVEATHDTTTTNEIIPVNGSEVGTYSADTYVLYPQTSSPVDSTTSDDPIYDLVAVSNLNNYTNSTGWINSLGAQLTKADLYKMFSLTYEISWDFKINIFNGSWDFGSAGLSNDTSIVAPIGSNGDEANIPKGCIAFKINNSNKDGYKARVIVAIPVSQYYPGQLDVNQKDLYAQEIDTTEDYYFGMWHTEQAGQQIIQTFSKNNAMEKFELPRSHAYELGADPATNDYILVEYGGQVCRAYLHGDQILVAYTFTATEEGVYVLGATNGPMEIVYFSVDSTASGGKDGITSYRLGTIDFVYDDSVNGSTANKIITVKDADPLSDGVYDYSNYYYPTLCLLYTDNEHQVAELISGDADATNGFANINDFAVYVKRRRTDDASCLDWQAIGGTQIGDAYADAAYLQFVRYAVSADTINRADDGLRE